MDFDDDPRARFENAQEQLIEHHGLDAESRFVEVDRPVDRMHYLHAGDGNPVLFLPGLASPAALFVPLMAELEDLFELFAVDRPGRGLSDPYIHQKGEIRDFTTEFIDGFLDGLDLDTVDIIASSFGGFQAISYTLDRPERVGRISFVGSVGGLTRELPIPFRLMGVKGINRLMFRLMSADSTEDVRASMERINVVDSSALSEWLLVCILTGSQIPEHQRSFKSLIQTTAGIRGTSKTMIVRDEVDELTQPLQFLWGTEDHFFDPSLGREVTASMSNVEFHELEGLGHTPWLEPENNVAELVEEFLAGS